MIGSVPIGCPQRGNPQIINHIFQPRSAIYIPPTQSASSSNKEWIRFTASSKSISNLDIAWIADGSCTVLTAGGVDDGFALHNWISS